MRPANTIEIGLKDHSMMLIDAEGHQLKELSEYFSFFVPGHRYMPAFKRRVWDGKIRLFNQMTRELRPISTYKEVCSRQNVPNSTCR